MKPRRIFLTAAWRNLAILNFPVEPELLKPHVPAGTEIDFHNGETYLSIVGFLFQQTSILNLPAIGHADFTEVNLRFYVRRKAETGEWRRGVVFVKEIVPHPAVTWVARTLYGENYVTLPMQRDLQYDEGKTWPKSVKYRWQEVGTWNTVGLNCANQTPFVPAEDSHEAFIIEHYWGYTHAGGGRTREYQVEHPPWQILPSEEVTWDCNAGTTYGPEFKEALSRPPCSAFLALGSEIAVRWASKLPA